MSSENFMKKPMSYYNTKTGYNRDFLNEVIPIPDFHKTIKDDLTHLKSGNKTELKYENFSIIMSKSRKLAFFSAVNVDASKFKTIEDKNGWKYDPRIEKKFQINNELYNDYHPLDRGHVVRRMDPIWGEKAEDAQFDTFHWTNATPQHKKINNGLWGKLEDHIMKIAETKKKITVFTGPIFKEDDHVERGYKIPERFWKIVYLNSIDSCKSIAFVISQKKWLNDLKFIKEDFTTYQIDIGQLSNLTKISFVDFSKPIFKIKKEPAFPIKNLSDIVI